MGYAKVSADAWSGGVGPSIWRDLKGNTKSRSLAAPRKRTIHADLETSAGNRIIALQSFSHGTTKQMQVRTLLMKRSKSKQTERFLCMLLIQNCRMGQTVGEIYGWIYIFGFPEHLSLDEVVVERTGCGMKKVGSRWLLDGM